MRDQAQPGILNAVGELQQLVAGQHQFAHQVHQIVEEADPDPHRVGASLSRAGVEHLLGGQHVLLAARTHRHQDFPDAPGVSALLLPQRGGQVLRTDASALHQQPADSFRSGRVPRNPFLLPQYLGELLLAQVPALDQQPSEFSKFWLVNGVVFARTGRPGDGFCRLDGRSANLFRA